MEVLAPSDGRSRDSLSCDGAQGSRRPAGCRGGLCGRFRPALSCCGGRCAAYGGGDECFGGAASVGEHGVVVAGGGESIRSFVEDGELSAQALRVGGSGLSRGRDEAGQECFLVFLDYSGDAGQPSGCFDRGVVKGAAAEDGVRVEWFEDGEKSLGRREVIAVELHLGRDGDLPFAAAQVGLDERVLGCEVLVESAGRYVGFIGERRDSGGVNPLLIEQLIRRTQDPFAG